MKRPQTAMFTVSVLAIALSACSNKAPELDQYGATPNCPRPTVP